MFLPPSGPYQLVTWREGDKIGTSETKVLLINKGFELETGRTNYTKAGKKDDAAALFTSTYLGDAYVAAMFGGWEKE
jgi:hypothetical protein